MKRLSADTGQSSRRSRRASGKGSAILWIQALGLLLGGTAILVVRSPDAVLHSVFYTEDGTWTGLGLTNGWAQALWDAKDGYLVIGNVVLLWIASQGSRLACGNELLCAPEWISGLSYLFFAGVATLSFMSTKARVPLAARGLLYCSLLLLPYGDSTNEILGRISNLGYSLVLVAVLCMELRHQHAHPDRRRVICDLVVLLCAATNPLVIPLAILVLFMHEWDHQSARGGERWSRFNWRTLRDLAHRNITLVAGLFSVAILVAVRSFNAVGPSRTGQLEWGSFVEVALARSILYPFLWPIYSSLDDLKTLGISAALFIGGTWIYLRTRQTPACALIRSLALALILSLVMTFIGRPSLTQQLSGYATTFPDRYFMGLNQLTLALAVILLGSLLYLDQPNRLLGYAGLALIGVSFLLGAERLVELRQTRFPIAVGPTWEQQMCTTEQHTHAAAALVDIPIYFDGWWIRVPAGLLHEATLSIECEG